jgi:TonB-dependent SusC/RagA subfamily outer membrane receptor
MGIGHGKDWPTTFQAIMPLIKDTSHMNKSIILYSLCCLVMLGYTHPMYGQSNDRMDSGDISPIQVYLHVDRVAYQQEEDIWFKAYVVHQSSGLLITEDIMIRVALRDQRGNSVVLKSVMISEGLGHGNLFIPDSIKTGKFKVIAYSRELESPLFTKEIQIQNNKSNFGVGSLFFTKTAYSSGDSVTAVYKSFPNKEVINKVKLKYEIRHGDKVIGKSTAHKYLHEDLPIKFKLPDTLVADYSLNITSFHPNEVFVTSYNVPTTLDIDLQFFPEGGHFVSGLENKLAFKAIDKHGRPIEVTGEMVNMLNGEKISFNSYYQGMGEITFTPSLADYKVILTKPVNIETVFNLPTVEAAGYTVFVDNDREDRLIINLSTTQSEEEEIVVAVVAGNKTFWLSEEYIDQNLTIEVPKKELPAGIVKVIIFNTQNTPILERIAFINKNSKVVINTDKETYRLREAVRTTLNISDNEGMPTTTHLSLAVVEQPYASSDRSSSILSHMLLSSELKGAIPTPGFYFNQKSPMARKALDLVMLTNGWRSYSWDEVLNPPTHNEVLNFKNQTSISGHVYDVKGKKAANNTVQIINKFTWNADEVTTDESGAFSYHTQLNSSTKDGFFVSAMESKRKLIIKLDQQQLGKAINIGGDTSIAASRPTQSTHPSVQYINNAYQINDARILEEVLIKNKKENYKAVAKNSIVNHSLFSTHQVQRISGDKLNNMVSSGPGDMYIIAWVRQVTSVAYVNKPAAGNVTLRGVPSAQGVFSGGPGPALFVVDGQPMGNDYRRLNHIDGNQIESIEVLRSSNAAVIYGTQAAGGVIMINTKQPTLLNLDKKNTLSRNPVSVTTRSQNKIFYTPQYEQAYEINDPTPDLRKTLHWEPNITTDKNGEAVISFYTGDRKGAYIGMLEGIDQNGNITHEKIYFEVK